MDNLNLNFVHDCLRENKPKIEDLYKFEYSETFDNLPDSREMKCFFYCCLARFGTFQEGTNIMTPEKLMDIINLMTTEEQQRILKLGRKCFKKNKDLCEMAYQIAMCGKRNSNQDFYVFWRNDTKPGPAIIEY